MSVTGNIARVVVGGKETKVKLVEMSMRTKKSSACRQNS